MICISKECWALVFLLSMQVGHHLHRQMNLKPEAFTRGGREDIEPTQEQPRPSQLKASLEVLP